MYQSDGLKITNFLNAGSKNGGYWLSLKWSLVAPDDRVEYDFFTYPDDTDSEQWIQDWKNSGAVDSLGSSALFTPHYDIISGEYDAEDW